MNSSKFTRTWTANNPENSRMFEFLETLTAKKFEADIIQGVHATLCGDGDRYKKMIRFVKMKMYALQFPTKYVATLKDVCEAAAYFFRVHKTMMSEHKVSIIFICGWKLEQ